MASRGRSPVTWEGRTEQYLCLDERVTRGRRAIEAAKNVCNDRTVWRPIYHGHPMTGSSLAEQGVEDTYTYKAHKVGCVNKLMQTMRKYKQINFLFSSCFLVVILYRILYTDR